MGGGVIVAGFEFELVFEARGVLVGTEDLGTEAAVVKITEYEEAVGLLVAFLGTDGLLVTKGVDRSQSHT